MPDRHIIRIIDGLRDFLVDKPAITTPQIVKLFLHGGLCYPQSYSQALIRNICSLRREVEAQWLKQPEPVVALAVLTPPRGRPSSQNHSACRETSAQRGVHGATWREMSLSSLSPDFAGRVFPNPRAAPRTWLARTASILDEDLARDPHAREARTRQCSSRVVM